MIVDNSLKLTLYCGKLATYRWHASNCCWQSKRWRCNFDRGIHGPNWMWWYLLPRYPIIEASAGPMGSTCTMSFSACIVWWYLLLSQESFSDQMLVHSYPNLLFGASFHYSQAASSMSSVSFGFGSHYVETASCCNRYVYINHIGWYMRRVYTWHINDTTCTFPVFTIGDWSHALPLLIC